MHKAIRNMNSMYKKVIGAGLALLVLGIALIIFIFNDKFSDTAQRKAAYTVQATDLLTEFHVNDSLANKKYTEKIVAVSGRVTDISKSDSSVNIIMSDSLSGNYLIFAFQDQHIGEGSKLQVGDEVTIKASCSGGNYSEILDSRYISFKRAAIYN